MKSPLNRVAMMTLDDKLRPLTVTQPGLTPVTYTYDGRGRVQTVTQGARSQAFTYGSNGALETVTNALNETTCFTTDWSKRDDDPRHEYPWTHPGCSRGYVRVSGSHGLPGAYRIPKPEAGWWFALRLVRSARRRGSG